MSREPPGARGVFQSLRYFVLGDRGAFRRFGELRSHRTVPWFRGIGTPCGLLGRIVLALLCLGCASYRGTAQSVSPVRAMQGGKWWMVPNFPLVMQEGSHDCGAAALSAVLRYWGYSVTPSSIEHRLGKSERRLVAGEIVGYARELGLNAYVFYGTMTDVVHEVRRGRPVIVGLGKSIAEKKALSHYEVVVGYEPEQKQVMLLDPGRGWQVDSFSGFGEEWARTKGVTIVAFVPASHVRQ